MDPHHRDSNPIITGVSLPLSAKFLRKTNLQKEDLLSVSSKLSTIANTTTMARNRRVQRPTGGLSAIDILRNVAAAARYSNVNHSGSTSKGPQAPHLPAEIQFYNASRINVFPTSLPSQSLFHPGSSSTIHPQPMLKASTQPQGHGLTLSPEELDCAKNLVLDLLGWGVDPEYLVDSGVSAEVVFRIFTDLNLRLPTNLVVSEDLRGIAYSWGSQPSSNVPGYQNLSRSESKEVSPTVVLLESN